MRRLSTYRYSWILACVALLAGASAAWSRSNCNHHVEFGMDTGFGIYHLGTELGASIKATEADRAHYLDAVRDLGITTIRDDVLLWSEIQPERNGPYHFEVMDDFVRKASERGIHIVSLAYFFPPWATVDEDRPWNYEHGQDGRYQLPLRKYRPQFEAVIKATVGRYCGCRPDSLQLKNPVREWLFMNEPEGYAAQFLDANEYAYWLKIFYEQVKSVDPGATVVAPAVAVPGVWRKNRYYGKFVENLLSSPELRGPHYPYFDILDFHPYPGFMGPPTPNLFAPHISYSYLCEVQAAHKLNLPMWVTEIGDNSIDLTQQADRDVEYVVEAASTGVDRVYLLFLWDFNKKLYGGHPWGLLEDTPSGQIPARKPAFTAYQTLLHKISNNEGIEFLAPGRYRVLLDSGRMLYVLWVQDGYSLTPNFLHGKLRVTDLKNQTQETQTSDLKLTEHPVIVEPLE